MGGPESHSTVDRSFPQSRRIKRSGEFGRLKVEGRRQVCDSLILNWQVRPLSPVLPADESVRRKVILAGTRLGVVTSRQVGNAVARSRARRLLREVFRAHQSELQQPADLVLVARPSIVRCNFTAVERHFLQCLRRAGLIVSSSQVSRETSGSSASSAKK